MPVLAFVLQGICLSRHLSANREGPLTRYGLATSSEVLEKEGLLPFRMLYTYGDDRNQVKFHFNTIVTIAKTTMIIITGAQGGKLEEGIDKTVDP